ncbi:hypothetical protein [Flavonifractor plautii]|uniref:hypothetical protein n=1 Tax=Flavonifractor plautii TaxID=292800 RepID=UPI0032C17DE4
MKKRIIPLFFLVLLLATVMIPTSAAISTKAISGKPTLKIEGTTAYCVGKYNSILYPTEIPPRKIPNGRRHKVRK